MAKMAGFKLKKVFKTGALISVILFAMLIEKFAYVYAGGGQEEVQESEEMESFRQADSRTYASFGIGRFNTYAIFRIYGSNGAAYSSDLFNSITADEGIISPYKPYVMNTEYIDGKEVNSYVYDINGNKIQSQEPWYYVGCLIPDDYYDLFDISIAANGQVDFSPKQFSICTDTSYTGGRYVAYNNSLGMVMDENLTEITKKQYATTYPICTCNNICGYISSGGSSRLALSGNYDWNAALCAQYKNHIKDGYAWMKVSWNTVGISSKLQKHYADYKHKFILTDRQDWRWEYTSSDGGRMVILYSNWWTEGGISFTRDADSRYRALNEYIINNYGETKQFKNYYILTDFVTVLWDETGDSSGKQLEYNKNQVFGVEKIYDSIADVKENMKSANFVTYMKDREVSGWTIKIGENASAAITVNLHMINSATGVEEAAVSIGLNDENILPGSTINKNTILNNNLVNKAIGEFAAEKNCGSINYANKMTAFNSASDTSSTNIHVTDYKISTSINSYTTIDAFYYFTLKYNNSIDLTPTPTPVEVIKNTPRPTATNTPRPTATNTPRPTATSAPRPTATSTPRPTATSTPRPTATSTPRPTATSTPRPTATSTPRPTATSTPRPTKTNTPTPLLNVTNIKVNNSSQISCDSKGNPIMKQGNKLDFSVGLSRWQLGTSIYAIPHYYYYDGKGNIEEARLFSSASTAGGILTLREAGIDYSDILTGKNEASYSNFTYVFPYSSYVLAEEDYTAYLNYKKTNTVSGQEPFFKKEGVLYIKYDFEVRTIRGTFYYERAFMVTIILNNDSTWIH